MKTNEFYSDFVPYVQDAPGRMRPLPDMPDHNGTLHYQFALYPENIQPSGHVNFSKPKLPVYKVYWTIKTSGFFTWSDIGKTFANVILCWRADEETIGTLPCELIMKILNRVITPIECEVDPKMEGYSGVMKMIRDSAMG